MTEYIRDASHGVIHVSGVAAQFEKHLRQRCSWCGALLINMKGENEDEVGDAITWPVGVLIAMDEHADGSSYTWKTKHDKNDPLPANACARLDPDITV